MRCLFTIVLFTLTLAAQTNVGVTQTNVRVSREAQPERALSFEVEVPASLDEVWTAFTTSDGLSTWLTPVASVDSAREVNGPLISRVARQAAERSSTSRPKRSL